jgi:hypothetical protein
LAGAQAVAEGVWPEALAGLGVGVPAEGWLALAHAGDLSVVGLAGTLGWHGG